MAVIPGGARLKLRWILGLIVLVLAVGLAACGGGGDNNEKESPTAEKGTPAATKTAEAAGTQKPAETAEATKTAEPSSGGGASLGDVPVYPGADKVGDYSGSSPIPIVGEGLSTTDYKDTKWAVYETSDSASDVAAFYKDKMASSGWKQEGWFDTSVGNGAAYGGFSRDNGNTGAWVAVAGSGDKTEIVIGTGTK
jgi:hypothetical protein